MNPRIQFLLDGGESRHVEFKTARKTLNRDIYETVCAFLNRDGGEILLGVRDSGEVSGVDPERAQLMKQDFVNAINNPQKLTPPCYLSINTVDFEGALLLHIVVPPSSQIHRCNGRIFDRNEDGDFDITDNQALVTQRYLSKQSHYSENTIYPYAAMSDLDSNLIARARRLASVHQRSHPWETMDDQELLTSARLIQKDFLQNKEGLTLAAILLFGKDETILSVLPHHRTDAILRRVDVDRYDDRDDIRTNLLDSHDRLIAFGEKHLSDPFFLEGTQRISIRSHILREIIGNLLIHREYSHAFPAKFVIERDCLFSENSNRPHGHGPIDPRLFSPYPKNPVIAKVFKEIGWADELGSGVRKLFRYGKTFGGHDPELLEDDIFRINLPLANDVSDGLAEGLAENQQAIVRLIHRNPRISKREMAERVGISTTAIDKNLETLKGKGIVQRVGSAKHGHWEVLP